MLLLTDERVEWDQLLQRTEEHRKKTVEREHILKLKVDKCGHLICMHAAQ